jgi:hypothetical protein
MSYFSEYPEIKISDPLTNSPVFVKDIFRRIKLNPEILKNEQYFQYYIIKSGERPEQISFNFYGDTKYFWTIMMANDIYSYNDWAKSDNELDELLYNTPDQIRHYETIELKNNIGNIILPSGLVVEQSFSTIIDGILYTGSAVRIPITEKEYIIRKNEQKKLIILLNFDVVQNLDNQFNSLIKFSTNILDNGRKFQEI